MTPQEKPDSQAMNDPNYNLPADAPERRGTAESQQNSKLKNAHTPISDADGNQIGYSTSKTDEKGRVLRQTELIAKDLEPLLKQRHSPDYPIQDLQLLAYELATYVLEQKYQAYAHDVRLGVDMGRRETATMVMAMLSPEAYGGKFIHKEVTEFVKQLKEQVEAITQVLTRGAGDEQ